MAKKKSVEDEDEEQYPMNQQFNSFPEQDNSPNIQSNSTGGNMFNLKK